MNDDWWENFRRNDLTIDLQKAYEDCVRFDEIMKVVKDTYLDAGKKFLEAVEMLQPIKSRQVATIAISMAMFISFSFQDLKKEKE